MNFRVGWRGYAAPIRVWLARAEFSFSLTLLGARGILKQFRARGSIGLFWVKGELGKFLFLLAVCFYTRV